MKDPAFDSVPSPDMNANPSTRRHHRQQKDCSAASCRVEQVHRQRELRQAKAKATREKAAAKQKATLQRKLAAKNQRSAIRGTTRNHDDASTEIERLEAQLEDGTVSAASAHGLKKWKTKAFII